MHVLPVTIPGTWIAHQDEAWAHQVLTLLNYLQSRFEDATAALHLYQVCTPADGLADLRAMAKLDPNLRIKASRERLMRRRAFEDEVRNELGIDEDEIDPSDELKDLVAQKVFEKRLREQAAAGILPSDITDRFKTIHARAFIYALDSFDRCLSDSFEKIPPMPAKLSAVADKVSALLPDLRGVRNSAHHSEQRALGLTHGKPIVRKPVDHPQVQAPEGLLINEAFFGDDFVTTTERGHLGKVEVSQRTLEIMHGLLVQAYECFDWTGPKRRLPAV